MPGRLPTWLRSRDSPGRCPCDKTAGRRSWQALCRDDAGAAAVEMAAAVPVLLILVFMIVHGTVMLFAHHTIGEAARAGARFAIVHGADSDTPVDPQNPAAVVSTVRAAAGRLDQERLSVAVTYSPADSNAPGSTVNVEARYRLDPVPLLAGNGEIVLSRSSRMTIVR